MNTSRDYRTLLVLVDPGQLFRCLVFRQMCLIYGSFITLTHGGLHWYRRPCRAPPAPTGTTGTPGRDITVGFRD